MSYTNSTAGTALNQPYNAKSLLDVNYIVTTLLPNAANNVNSSGLDLQQAVPYPVSTDQVDVQIIIVGGAGANNKNVNVWMEDSADNGNWTNTVGLANPLVQVTDNQNTNTGNNTYTFKLMPGGRRYIRVALVGEANGGAGTNGSATLQLLF